MAKNYETENRNSKNSTNSSYENETNSQDCRSTGIKRKRCRVLSPAPFHIVRKKGIY